MNGYLLSVKQYSGRILIVYTFLPVFMLLMYDNVSGQENFEHITTRHGLPASQVFDIMQDYQGYLLFATEKGISRFDGYEFKNFDTQNGITDNAVLRFFPQENGEIWCSTFNRRIFYFHPPDYTFKAYKYNHLVEFLPSYNIINNILMDQEGNLSIGFLRSGVGFVHISSEGEVKNFGLNSSDYNKMVNVSGHGQNRFTAIIDTNENISHLFQDYEITELENMMSSSWLFSFKKDDYLVGSMKDRLYIKKGNSKKEIITESTIMSLGEIEDDVFWAAGRGHGATFYNYKGEVITTILPDKSITDIYVDHEKGMWFSTLESGVFYLKNNQFVTKGDESIKDKYAISLTTHKDKLFVSYNNATIYSYDNGRFEEYLSLGRSTLSLCYVDHHPDYGLVSLLGLHYVYANKDIIDANLYSKVCLTDDAEGDIIVGTTTGFLIFNNKEKCVIVTLPMRPWDMLNWDGGYYVGTSNGLHYWKDGDFSDVSGTHPLLKYRSDDIDKSGDTIYMASQGAGLIIYRPDTIFNITHEQGLYSNLLSEVYIENDSVIWTCSNKGLNKIVFAKDGYYRVSGISLSDGLTSNEVTDVEIFDDSVWIATKEGLMAVPVSFLEQKNPVKDFFLKITDVKVNGDSSDLATLTSLDYDQNRLNISFMALSFRYNRELEYRYRLKGLESQWNYTKNLSASYSYIEPGSYCFELQAKINDSSWEDNLVTFPVIVAAPYYSKWWFWTIIIVFVVFSIYLFFKVNILSYNRDISREILRHLLRKIRKAEPALVVRENGKDVKIPTVHINYVKSSGNYLEIYTSENRHLIRAKMNKFPEMVPDPLEFLRIHRSYFVRIDKVTTKNNKSLFIKDKEIPVGESYRKEVNSIHF